MEANAAPRVMVPPTREEMLKMFPPVVILWEETEAEGVTSKRVTWGGLIAAGESGVRVWTSWPRRQQFISYQQFEAGWYLNQTDRQVILGG